MEYWVKRQLEAQNRITNRGIKATEQQLRKYYLNTMNKTIGQFEKTYNKVLSSIKEEKEVTPADLYKLDKYWQMQGQLQQELQKLGDKTHQLMSKQFTQQYKDVYECLPFKDGAMFNTIDEATASQMINQIWCADGKNWSERIWTNTDKLQQALNDNLIHCVVSGKTTSELNRMLQQDFKASFSRADTIIRTEMARIQTQSALDRYKSYGIQQVEILADDAGCTHCEKLHKTKYFVNENIPIPAHPNCRCCIIPVVDENLTTLEKDDITIGRSVGAKARNYNVKEMGNSRQHYRLAEGTKITKIKVIMGKGTKTELQDRYNIAVRNGIKEPDEIQKLRGEGFVVVKRRIRKAELHWYQANGVNYEFKIKRYLDEG